MATLPGSAAADTRPPKRGTGKVRYVILAVLFLGITINYIDRATVSVAAPSISKDFGLSSTTMGLILSSFFWTYTLGQMPGGFLADKIGTRVTLAIASVWWGLATCAMGLARGVGWLFGMRLLLGLGEAPSFPASAKVVSRWFPRSERSFASATFNNGNAVGATLSIPLVALVIAALGWRWAFVVAGALGVVWALVWWLYYREPRQHRSVTQQEIAYIEADQEPPVTQEASVTWRELFRFRTMWAMMIGFFCVNFVAYFFITWFPSYLVDTYHLSLLKFGFFGMIPGIASMIGGWCGGLFSDYLVRRGTDITKARKIPLVGGLLGTSVIALAAISPSLGTALAALSAAYFSSTFAAASVWALPSDVAPTPAHVGSIAGIQNTTANLAEVISPLLMGVLKAVTDSFVLPLLIAGAVALVGASVYAFVLPQVRRLRLE
jgi:D-galactonate transporter